MDLADIQELSGESAMLAQQWQKGIKAQADTDYRVPG